MVLSMAQLVMIAAGQQIAGPPLASFAFEAKTAAVEVLESRAGPMGGNRLQTASVSAGTTSSASDGASVAGTIRCIAWNTPLAMNIQGICWVAEGKDSYSIGYRCGLADGVGGCGGLLAGETGRYAARTGTISWRVGDGSMDGFGMWLDVPSPNLGLLTGPTLSPIHEDGGPDGRD